MTPKEMQTAADALAKKIGERAAVCIRLNTSRYSSSKRLCHGSVYPSGIGVESAFIVEADDWAELFDALNAKWDEHFETYIARLIQDIALAIIRITAEQGGCSDAALRAAGFTAADSILAGTPSLRARATSVRSGFSQAFDSRM